MNSTLERLISQTDCQTLRPFKAFIPTIHKHHVTTCSVVTATGVILVSVSNSLLVAPARADEPDPGVGGNAFEEDSQPADSLDDSAQPRLSHWDWTVADDPDWYLRDEVEGEIGADDCWTECGETTGATDESADVPMDWIVDDEAVLKEDGLEWLTAAPVAQGDDIWVNPATTSWLLEPSELTPAVPNPAEQANPIDGAIASQKLAKPSPPASTPVSVTREATDWSGPTEVVQEEEAPLGDAGPAPGESLNGQADWDLASDAPLPDWNETNWDDPDLLAQENLAWLIPQSPNLAESDRFDPYTASLLIDQGEQWRQASLDLDHLEPAVAIAPIDIPDLATQPFPDLTPDAPADNRVVLPPEVGAIADWSTDFGDPASDWSAAPVVSLPLVWGDPDPAELLVPEAMTGAIALLALATPHALLLSQASPPDAADEPPPNASPLEESATEEMEAGDAEAEDIEAEDRFYNPEIQTQAIYLLEGDDSSARGRVTVTQVINPSLIAGATVDLTGGDAFADSREEGLNLNELYLTAALPDYPNLRFTVGLLDLTSYFDRNSFAKDAATHFFNAVFQTNPALSATSIASRPGLLVRLDPTDFVSFRAATFSSTRDLGDFELDGFAGEVAVRAGTGILRATYVTAEDEGEDDGFREIFQFNRGDGEFGLQPGDREEAFGLNGEYFVPRLNLGLFARFGRYNNRDLDEGGSTFSFGFNLLDLFLQDDRLGLAYGRQLSNSEIRRDNDDPVPDVLELFYDIRLTRNLRFGVTLQQRDGFSETVAGLRIRADFDNSDFGRIF